MAGNDLAAFARKMDAVQRDLTGQTSRSQMARVGKKLEPEIDRAVRGDLGDTSMSGWRRKKAIEIVGSSKVLSDHAVIVQPTPESKGPMAVLERGRNITSGLGAMQGPGVSADGSTKRNKNGALRKVRARKARRWNGYTDPKYTMSAASQAIKVKAPALVEGELVRALSKHLRRG
jgi:hypothetical protein